jgi:hypothetical protein
MLLRFLQAPLVLGVLLAQLALLALLAQQPLNLYLLDLVVQLNQSDLEDLLIHLTL